MIWAFLTLILVGIIFGPQWWARQILSQHGHRRADIPQSGSEFANALIRHVDLAQVGVELATPNQDHFDPIANRVRLSPNIYEENSLTAIVVAAHEVGHAIQHASNYWPLKMRTNLVGFATNLEKASSVILIAAPFAGLLTRNPRLPIFMTVFMVGSMLASTLIHLITLPVEFDASFKRAMPYLRDVKYLTESDIQAAKKILWACALTYVARSLATLLNVWRWLRVLRR